MPLPDRILTFAESAEAGNRLARALDVPCDTIEVHAFPDDERRVRVSAVSPRTAIYRSLNEPNTKLIELLLAAAAARDSGARELCLIAPYLPYMRQDTAFRPGEAISQKVVGRLIADAFDRLVAIDPHLHRTPHLADVVGGKPALALSAARAIAAHIAARTELAGAVVLGPDEESAPLIRDVSTPLGAASATAVKQRMGDRDVAMTLPDSIDLAQKPVVIIDDMITSGTTIATLTEAARRRGASSIDVYVTHAMFDARAARMFAEKGVRRVVSCDSVPHSTNDISVAGIIAEGLRSWR